MTSPPAMFGLIVLCALLGMSVALVLPAGALPWLGGMIGVFLGDKIIRVSQDR